MLVSLARTRTAALLFGASRGAQLEASHRSQNQSQSQSQSQNPSQTRSPLHDGDGCTATWSLPWRTCEL